MEERKILIGKDCFCTLENGIFTIVPIQKNGRTWIVGKNNEIHYHTKKGAIYLYCTTVLNWPPK